MALLPANWCHTDGKSYATITTHEPTAQPPNESSKPCSLTPFSVFTVQLANYVSTWCKPCLVTVPAAATTILCISSAFAAPCVHHTSGSRHVLLRCHCWQWSGGLCDTVSYQYQCLGEIELIVGPLFSALALEASSPSSNDPIIACMTRKIANQTFVEAYMVNRVCRI